MVYASLLECFVHKVVFHRWYLRRHAVHHADYGGAKFRQPGRYVNLQPWWLELAVVIVHSPACMVLADHAGAAAGITALVVLTGYAVGSNYLHTAIHRPHDRLVERTAWFQRLVVRHRAHHADARVNFTVPTQIGDRLFRTFRG